MIVALLMNPAVRQTEDGRVAMVYRTGDIPASAIRINGVALDSTGTIYVTRA